MNFPDPGQGGLFFDQAPVFLAAVEVCLSGGKRGTAAYGVAAQTGREKPCPAEVARAISARFSV